MRKKSKKGDSCNPLISMVLRKRKHKLYMFDITFFNVKMYSNEINEIKNSHEIGDTMTLTINRNGDEKEVTITLEETP